MVLSGCEEGVVVEVEFKRLKGADRQESPDNILASESRLARVCALVGWIIFRAYLVIR